MQGRRGRGKSPHWASCSNPSSPAASTGLCELGRWRQSAGGWCRLRPPLVLFPAGQDPAPLPHLHGQVFSTAALVGLITRASIP